ncbi:MAG: PEP-CTERM sorting domain-containing protein [Okeania sp. SIO2F4]|uniref:PEP-CTERM sorting domain-containing protein n=1 Tax=Okeania sp. SIO2F4 TaxID=2607790 RepID=UPI00142D0AF1|nr:PEP-CTERM sorting domain-containing protein [Okeania sp. SIO2F4]NES03390.1 PEP-CTERM sorting domain-containing protein [Okeania sp. SIO2F4]
MKNQIVASIAAIPFAVGALFAGTGAAEAAGLTGGFSIGSTMTTITLSEGELSFDPNPGPVGLAVTSGSFMDFNSAAIQGPLTFDGSTGTPYTVTSFPDTFLDFGNLDFPGLDVPNFGIDDSSITDGISTFSLTKSEIHVMQAEDNPNVDILVSLYGIFEDEDGKQTKGKGDLTLQLADTNVAYVENILNGTNPSASATFSGALVGEMKVATPEPTALFGLGVVATGLVASRRKKSS